MTYVELGLMRRRSGARENIERLFQAAFDQGTERPDRRTLFGWKPVAEWYAEPASARDMWRPAVALAIEAAHPGPAAEPVVRVRQLPGMLRIDVHLPFLVRSSVRVEVRDNVLTLRGEQAVPGRQGVMDADMPPRRRFQRVFPLPAAAAPGSVRARFSGPEAVRIEVRAA